MIRRRTIGLGAALAFLGSAAFLVSGHPLLNWPATGLPLGTLVAGVMVAALGALPLAIAPRTGVVRQACVGVLALAVAWLPASLWLAGNWRLNFSPGPDAAAATWLGLLLVVALACSFVLATASRLVEAWRRKRVSRSSSPRSRR